MYTNTNFNEKVLYAEKSKKTISEDARLCYNTFKFKFEKVFALNSRWFL